jgi:hypothetical protein
MFDELQLGDLLPFMAAVRCGGPLRSGREAQLPAAAER